MISAAARQDVIDLAGENGGNLATPQARRLALVFTAVFAPAAGTFFAISLRSLRAVERATPSRRASSEVDAPSRSARNSSSRSTCAGGRPSRDAQAFGNSALNVTGGSVKILASRDNGVVIVSGGRIRSSVIGFGGTIDISGGQLPGELSALFDSTITISGSAFNLPSGDVVALSGTLTGTLADGSPVDLTFVRASTARIAISVGWIAELRSRSVGWPLSLLPKT